MTAFHVAVIDVGKTNVKLVLVDLADLSELALRTRPNTVRPGPPYPHFDIEGHWAFVLDGLAAFQASHGIDAISMTTHGASAVLLEVSGQLAAPVLDYEHSIPEDAAAAYDAIRPAFDETGSPRLAGGLNIGAQIHWQFRRDRGLGARVARILTYPQYWSFRLCGTAACEVTSLGSHSDLWNPHAGQVSSLVAKLGIADRLAPVRAASDVLGPVLPEIAAKTGIAPGTPVHCGIHDSNASLLPHVLDRSAPFSVVSTGTWVVAMTVGGRADRLDPARNTLINVNALGGAVPSANFMGGREHDVILGGAARPPTDAEIDAILDAQTMLLPAVAQGTGPFPAHASQWRGTEPVHGSGTRTAAAAYYLALMTAECLGMTGQRGDIIVEGPFSRNHPYLEMLAAATGTPVFPAEGATGTSQGAALLAAGDRLVPRPVMGAQIICQRPSAMTAYARAWRTHVSAT